MKILVIGETCVDEFIYGKIDRLCPEAPVPIFVPIETIHNPGMSGNVVANIKALNSKVKIEHWHQSELITKTRFVDHKSNQMVIRVDKGDDDVTPLKHLHKNIETIKKADIVIVSDYNKGFINDNYIIDIARNAKFSILDSKRKLNRDLIKHFTFVKLNESEALQNKEISQSLNIITTLGSKGTSYQGKIIPQNNPQQTIDVSGAGDTFVAAFALDYYSCLNVVEAIDYANQMASNVVSKRGVATP
jgi:D-beta-D-heptose 7-phosphate kinase/D-beta-D-heptose 1-phosphate adenosyltransferase